MQYLIKDGQICGKNFPLLKGYDVVEDENDYAENIFPDLYVDKDNRLQLKPPRPSDVAAWNGLDWVEPDLRFTAVELTRPDYLAFRLNMLQDAGYDRITIASNVLRVTRMETAVSQNPPELSVVAAMWNVLIDELKDKPKAAEVKAWNAIAAAAKVAIKFEADGKMSVI